MSEIPGLPSPDGEWKLREAAQELRMEQARLMAEIDEPKIWRLPLEGGLYWARKNNVPAAVWLHNYFARYRIIWIIAELLFWGVSLTRLYILVRHFSSR
jgi:hypothetical protein